MSLEPLFCSSNLVIRSRVFSKVIIQSRHWATRDFTSIRRQLKEFSPLKASSRLKNVAQSLQSGKSKKTGNYSVALTGWRIVGLPIQKNSLRSRLRNVCGQMFLSKLRVFFFLFTREQAIVAPFRRILTEGKQHLAYRKNGIFSQNAAELSQNTASEGGRIQNG